MSRSETAQYRLKKRSLIEKLFSRTSTTSRTIAQGLVAIKFDLIDRTLVGHDEVPFQAGVTTNRRIRRAVDRNSIKRMLRESVALQREALTELRIPSDKVLIFMMIYRGEPGNVGIHESAELALSKMVRELKALGRKGTSQT